MKKKYDFSVTKVARKLGVKPVTIYNRILWGWPIEKAISTPPRNKKNPNESKIIDFSCLGGWRINILNRPKCREYKFQAYNTVTGEFLKANDSDEIKRIMYKIIANL